MKVIIGNVSIKQTDQRCVRATERIHKVKICCLVTCNNLTSRSVLEALLKRGSSVVLVCSEADGQLGRAEVARLRWAAVIIGL